MPTLAPLLWTSQAVLTTYKLWDQFCNNHVFRLQSAIFFDRRFPHIALTGLCSEFEVELPGVSVPFSEIIRQRGLEHIAESSLRWIKTDLKHAIMGSNVTVRIQLIEADLCCLHASLISRHFGFCRGVSHGSIVKTLNALLSFCSSFSAAGDGLLTPAHLIATLAHKTICLLQWCFEHPRGARYIAICLERNLLTELLSLWCRFHVTQEGELKEPYQRLSSSLYELIRTCVILASNRRVYLALRRFFSDSVQCKTLQHFHDDTSSPWHMLRKSYCSLLEDSPIFTEIFEKDELMCSYIMVCSRSPY